MSLKNEILKFAEQEDMDLVGFANRERFSELEAKLNPFTIFPEGNTVILIGERITRGSLRGIEEGSNFQDYGFYGYKALDDVFTAQSCYDIVCFIENRGWEAVPVFPNPVESAGTGIEVAEGKEKPNVTPDFNYAAVACGLGEIGMNREFINDVYGTRIRFQMIITDAIIESDPINSHNLCDLCGKCADICPLDAIDLTKTETIEICGKTMKVASVDYNKCSICKNGVVLNRLYKSAKPDRLAALCNRTCLSHLEESGKLKNTFKNKFRKRQPWTLDLMGKAGYEK